MNGLVQHLTAHVVEGMVAHLDQIATVIISILNETQFDHNSITALLFQHAYDHIAMLFWSGLLIDLQSGHGLIVVWLYTEYRKDDYMDSDVI